MKRHTTITLLQGDGSVVTQVTIPTPRGGLPQTVVWGAPPHIDTHEYADQGEVDDEGRPIFKASGKVLVDA